MLIMAYRRYKNGTLKWNDPQACLEVGNQLKEGFATGLHAYADEPLAACLAFADGCGVSWKKMARQLMFWTDNGPEGYPKWVEQKKLPPKLYPKNIHSSIDSAPNFKPGFGHTFNGADLDIGPENGPSGLIAFEQACVIFSAWAVGLAEEKADKGVTKFELSKFFNLGINLKSAHNSKL
jgi:hypothetical protein